MYISLVWLALVVSMISTIPQIIQIIRTKEARDFNTTSQYLAILSNFLIAAESLRGGDIAALTLASWLIVYRIIILYYKLYPPPGILIRNQVEGEF